MNKIKIFDFFFFSDYILMNNEVKGLEDVYKLFGELYPVGSVLCEILERSTLAFGNKQIFSAIETHLIFL